MTTRELAFCLLSAWCVSFTAAFLFDNTGVVSPSNPYVFIGETLNLTCKVTDLHNYPGNVSESLYFTKMYGNEERPLPYEYVQIIDSRSILLEYPVTSAEDQGGYTCLMNRTSGNPMVINQQYTTVEYRASPIKEDDTVTVVDDWKSMTVTWDLRQEYVNKDLVKSWLEWTIIGDTPYACPHNTTTSCTWLEHDERDSLKMTVYHMRIFVATFKRVNGQEVETDRAVSDWFSRDSRYLVKPSPVEDLKAKDVNSSCVSLSWKYTEDSTSMRALVHSIVVIQGSVILQNLSTIGSSILVCELTPATSYTFNVSRIPKPLGRKVRGYYSDVTEMGRRTLEDVPSAAPKMVPGSFWIHSCPTAECDVIVYWKALTKEESNGVLTAYQLKLTNIKTGEYKIYDTSGSERSRDVTVMKDSSYSAEVRAGTAIGFSTMVSTITIPSQDKYLAFPSSFLVETQNSTLYLSWTPPVVDTPITYTVYYCNGSKLSWKCDEIHWIHVRDNRTSYELLMVDGNPENKLVGISSDSHASNHSMTSGILWALCIYSRDKVPAKVDNFNFSAYQPNKGLLVEWVKPECTEATGSTPYITQYVLTYCIGTKDKCSGPLNNATLRSSSFRRQSQEIPGLTVGAMYRVTLRAVSKAGRQGPESDPIAREVVNKVIGLSTGELSGIAVAGVFFFILLLAVGVFIIRRVHRSAKNFKYPVVLPPTVGPSDDVPDVPKRNPPTLEENNNKKPLSSEVERNTTPEEKKKSHDETISNTGNVDGSESPETSLDHNYSRSSSTSSSNSANSTTLLISRDHHKQTTSGQGITLPIIGSTQTESTDLGYKSLSDVMKTDSSENGSTDASYSKVAISYSPDPGISVQGETPEMVQTTVKPEVNPTLSTIPECHPDYVGVPCSSDSQEVVPPKQNFVDKGSLQNADYVRCEQY